MDKNMNTPPIVSAQEWEAARQQLLVKEKAMTHARHALAAERRRMPWLAVEKAYEFDGPQGKASLLDLFDGRRQLIVYRAFFEPGVYGRLARTCVPRLLVRGRPGRPCRPSERTRHHACVRLARAADGHRPPAGTNGLEDAVVQASRTASTSTSAWTSGTAQTPSSATATRYSAHISSTTEATSRWGARGTTSTSRRSDVRRSGRTRRRATHIRRRKMVELARRIRRGFVKAVVERRRPWSRTPGADGPPQRRQGLKEANLEL